MERKGYSMSIRTLALIILGIMVVVLIYGAFSGWYEGVLSNFVGNVNYPET